ncbi:MAG: hypothetical protein PHI63_00095 [Patescibacteria group bacterium]|nr:hypothetical protein [Patescibacteria group bacterium]
MYAGRLLETILSVIMVAFIIMVLMAMLLIIEVANFIIGQNVSISMKTLVIGYLGIILAIAGILAIRKFHHLQRYG